MFSQAYELQKTEQISELNSTGYLLKHKKSGARVALLSNDDKNKVFNIGFRTPPKDDTGVAHIIEHTVLCGSKKFPAKDPFVELVKGSLNTFLNAITYPDKTMFPVASCNEKDFKNLMHVYLDAVFYPNIYQREEIFRQEGWSYELENPDEPLIYNGVVYNEMKGALSSADSVLERACFHGLFPDTCYGCESGGDPQDIPKLTYEEFLDFHRKYYHPSNSYIYLYGDMDMESYLEWLDEHYLKNFDEIQVDSEIAMQQPFSGVHYEEQEYSLGDEEDETEKYIYAYGTTAGLAAERNLHYAMKVLDYALISMPGAPVKQALLDAGIGKDISGGYQSASLQNSFFITAKEAEDGKREDFVRIVQETLQNLVKDGIDKNSLRAALNVIEFRYREADFGSYPKGLFYCLDAFQSWLYDDNEPFLHIQAGDTFAELNRLVDTDYYETLVQTYLLDNPHKLVLTLKPKKGLAQKMEQDIARKLEIYKNSLSKEEIETLIVRTKELKRYQSEPSTEEELNSIPVLKLEDIEPLPKKFQIEECRLEDAPVIFSELFSNQIAYINVSFDTKEIPEQHLPYLMLLNAVLAIMNTKNYKYSELNNIINMHSGGFYNHLGQYGRKDGGYVMLFENHIKVFYSEIPFAFEMMEEVLLHTDFSDSRRLKEIISEQRAKTRMKLMSAGYMTAIIRGGSYVTEAGKIRDMISGVEYYEFLCRLEDEFEECKENIAATLSGLCESLFTKKNLIVSLTCDRDGYEQFKVPFSKFCSHLYEGKEGTVRKPLSLEKKNEAWKIPSPVSYNACVGNFKLAGFAYNGALETLTNILDYDYLWNNIRVKGGAYGVMTSYAANSGNVVFVSDRDPNVKKTYDIFESIPEYLRSFEADERAILKFIIGTISSKDTPLNPAAEGRRSFSAYISGVSYEDICKERQEILTLSVEKVRKLAPLMEAVLAQGYRCTVGNGEKISESAELFKEMKELVK